MTAPAARPTGFLFVRHGETDWNVAGRLQGQLDIPLNRVGQRQAAESGLRLAALFARRSGAAPRFVASPLGRTRDTAERARLAMGLPPQNSAIDDRLKEFSFGTWEGLTWPEVRQRDPDRLRERRRDKWRFVPPGGESYAMLAERIRPWLDEVTPDTVAVSHGGVARALMVLVGGLSILAAPNAEIQQGRVLRFEGGGFSWL